MSTESDIIRAVRAIDALGVPCSQLEQLMGHKAILKLAKRISTSTVNHLRITYPIVQPINWSIVRTNVFHLVAPQFLVEVR